MLTDNLIKELNKALPKENILSDEAERYVYSFDASNNQQNKALPDAVVFVENIEQVLKVVKIANDTYNL